MRLAPSCAPLAARRVGGAQHAGHEPGLPADLGDHPASERRDPAGKCESGEYPQEPARWPRLLSRQTPNQASTIISTPIPTIRRNAKNNGATGGASVRVGVELPTSAFRRASGSGSRPSEPRSQNRCAASSLGMAKSTSGALLRFPDRLHRRDLRRLVLERIQAMQVADQCLQRCDHGGHDDPVRSASPPRIVGRSSRRQAEVRRPGKKRRDPEASIMCTYR